MSECTHISEINENNSPSNPIKNEIFEWVSNITYILSAIVLIFIFIIRVVGVDGPSMNPTLNDRDWLITSNLFYEPEQGDIVVLSKDSFRDGIMIVKRVIATEGQTIDIRGGLVYIDGKALDEPYINEPMLENIISSGRTELPLTIPEDHVFVMGDNRNHSADSRDATLGAVHKSRILGRVVLRVLPFSDFGVLN